MQLFKKCALFLTVMAILYFIMNVFSKLMFGEFYQ